MTWFTRSLLRTLAVALPLVVGAGGASAQEVIVEDYYPRTVTYYSSPRVVEYVPSTVSYYTPRASYYPARSVSYYPVESVSYYPARTVTYYSRPTASYYTAPVTTTRYGLFGRPRETTTYYPSYIVR